MFFQILTGFSFYLSSEFAFGSLREVWFWLDTPPLPQEKATQGIPLKKNCKKQEGLDKTLYINFISLFPIFLKT